MNQAAIDEFRRRGLSAKKSFGQNFLADRRIAEAIAALATEPTESAAPGAPRARTESAAPGAPGARTESAAPGAPTEASVPLAATVVEIGAGLGALTEPLLARASRVVAIERDRDLCPILDQAFAAEVEQGRLAVVAADAKSADYAALLASGPRPHVLAGNLPYQITGPLLETSVGLADSIDRAVFMVQAEVADRLAACPDSEAYGALTVFVQAAFRVDKRLRVGRAAFVPRPGVDSAVVVLTPHRPRRAVEDERFRQAVHAAFAQRRKKLRNAWAKLGSRLDIEARASRAGIDLDRRGETLSVDEFARFAQADP